MANKQLKGLPGSQLGVFGNYFMPEFRTAVALLELNEISFKENTFNMLSKDGREEYMKLNPSMEVPTIIDGSFTIMADPPTMYRWICTTKQVEQSFYPRKEMLKEQKKMIDKYLDYIQYMFRRLRERLTKICLKRKLIQDGKLPDSFGSKYEEAELLERLTFKT